MKQYEYTSALRIGRPNIAGLWDYLEKYPDAFNEVLFMTEGVHYVKNLDYHREVAAEFAPAVEKARKMGYQTGINIMCTIGFFEEGLDPLMEGHPCAVTLKTGAECKGRICTEHEINMEYVRQKYRIYAAAHPEIMYIDDDISSMSCGCDRCITRFCNDNALPQMSRAELWEKMAGEDVSERKNLREVWIRFNAQRKAELFAEIEKATHEVDPDIRIAFMSHMTGSDGLAGELWAQKLSGDGREISWRPGGSVYDDFSMPETLLKTGRISNQVRFLPENVSRVEAEIENFPYRALRKSPSFTAFEGFLYQAAGCTGVTYNVATHECPVDEEHEPFFKAAENAGVYGRRLTAVMGREPLRGVGFAWNRKTVAFAGEQNWRPHVEVPFAQWMYWVGMPVGNTEEDAVHLLNAACVHSMSDAELRECLSHGVMMDAPALKACNERGFGELTGFAPVECYERETMEVELPHPFNMKGAHRRNIRQRFPFMKEKQAYTIVRTDESAEYLTEHLDLKGGKRGYGCGIFENRLGGRVCVEGITPFEWYDSLSRSVYLKNVMRWLSKDALPGFVSSFHRAALWVRGKGAMVANLATEDAEGLELMLRTEKNVVNVTLTRGARIVEKMKLSAEGEENGYKKFVLPTLGVLGTALFEME